MRSVSNLSRHLQLISDAEYQDTTISLWSRCIQWPSAQVTCNATSKHKRPEPTQKRRTIDNVGAAAKEGARSLHRCQALRGQTGTVHDIMHRYAYCRCIVRMPSPISCEVELTLLIMAECPRHNATGHSFRDYHGDRYFRASPTQKEHVT